MIIIELNTHGHDWHKENLVTIFKGGKNYDTLVCSKCGIRGNTASIDTIAIKSSYSQDKIYFCTASKNNVIPEKIKITHCEGFGEDFKNLIDDSEHIVVSPPKGYKNDHTGVWVKGNCNVPVKLLPNEFIKL